jgi:hypothetical protein
VTLLCADADGNDDDDELMTTVVAHLDEAARLVEVPRDDRAYLRALSIPETEQSDPGASS